MFIGVEDTQGKRAAQKIMEQTLTRALTKQGTWNIGFPGGNADEILYSNGDKQLWCAFGVVGGEGIPRRWNAFGVFDSGLRTQIITAEINVPTNSNSARVAGFFARDPETGRTYLLHDGSVGGGRRGVGRDTFLAWSKSSLVSVVRVSGEPRDGIIVGDVGADDFPARLWRFVQVVRRFKDAVRRGELDDEEVLGQLADWDEFKSESSGRRQGSRRTKIDYTSYHGDVVECLYDERKSHRAPGEKVLNSRLIDLYVKSGEVITEVYEIKTSLERQPLYAAIGQLLTHSVDASRSVKRVLVIPEGIIADDLERCIASLDIYIRRFTLTRSQDPEVVLSGREEIPTG